MKNKKVIVMTTLLIAIVLLSIGTLAYFRRTVNGNITGNTGNLVLIVNEANSELNETFTINLQRSEEENFIMPDDKGVFDLNIDATGSTDDVLINLSIDITNLPWGLGFYLDDKYTEELNFHFAGENYEEVFLEYSWVIEKSDDMTMTVPIYWFWDGNVSDENDSEFINKQLNASVSVNASIAKTLYEMLMSFDKTIDTDVDFSKPVGEASSETFIESKLCYDLAEQCDINGENCMEFEQQCFEYNGRGLMLRDGTQNDEYPIVYYRGNISNNNVIFAGYCWQIVRTTETGGVKLIYSGEANYDGSCNNYTESGKLENYYTNSFLQTIFNSNNNSPVYVGYMYNDSRNYYDFSTKILDVTGYVAHLSDNTIDSETGHHTQNIKDSVVKEVIDEWYEMRIAGTKNEKLIEDTIWCNDRSVISEDNSIENYTINGEFYYSTFSRIAEPRLSLVQPMSTVDLKVIPNLTCTRTIDAFTVDQANGNGDLTYPIGMLTADELNLAGQIFGERIDGYLGIPRIGYWTMSPGQFRAGYAEMFFVYYTDLGSVDPSYNSLTGARPTISLNENAFVSDGNGSFETPYIVS